MRFACGHLHGCMKRKEEQEHPSKTGSIVPPLSPSLSLSLCEAIEPTSPYDSGVAERCHRLLIYYSI